MIRMVIDEASPSLNEFFYSHWRIQQAAKERWLKLLTIASRRAKATKATGPRRLTIERHGKKRLDLDNLIGGGKGCITDNLRALELLRNDDDASVEFVARNVPLAKGEKPHTVIVLEDLP